MAVLAGTTSSDAVVDNCSIGVTLLTEDHTISPIHSCSALCCLQLWDVDSGKECCTLSGHTAEIVSVCFNSSGNLLVTGSFDHDSRLWDVRTGQCVHVLSGHRGEVSSAVFDHAGNPL